MGNLLKINWNDLGQTAYFCKAALMCFAQKRKKKPLQKILSGLTKYFMHLMKASVASLVCSSLRKALHFCRGNHYSVDNN